MSFVNFLTQVPFTVITIFFATSMARADLPEWTKYILISYIVVYLIFYAAMTVSGSTVYQLLSHAGKADFGLSDVSSGDKLITQI